jgi:4-amino-4-deoxy-L-arabinose transferase-like glycosyltransferase
VLSVRPLYLQWRTGISGSHLGSKSARRNLPPLLIATIAVSILARLGSAVWQGSDIEPLPGIHDQISYDALARRVIDGHGFSFDRDWWPATRAGEPTAHWSFLYTSYLAGTYLLFGPNPLAARLLQALLAGLLQPWLTWRIGSRVFGESAGLTAAGISAVYAYFVYYAGALMTETFYILAILWTLDLVTSLGHPASHRSLSRWALLGLSLGIAISLRQVFAVVAILLVIWLIRRASSHEHPVVRRTLWQGPALCTLVAALLLAPWIGRNLVRFHRPVLNSNAGFVLFWSSHPIHGHEFQPILAEDGPTYGSLLPPHLLSLDEVALDRELFALGWAHISSDPARFAALSLGRAAEYFKFWPTLRSSRSSNLLRLLSFGILTPFILAGLIQTLRTFMRHWSGLYPGVQQSSLGCVAPLLLFAGSYSIIHIFTWSLIRYRLPVDSILILFAAGPILPLLVRVWRSLPAGRTNLAPEP